MSEITFGYLKKKKKNGLHKRTFLNMGMTFVHMLHIKLKITSFHSKKKWWRKKKTKFKFENNL